MPSVCAMPVSRLNGQHRDLRSTWTMLTSIVWQWHHLACSPRMHFIAGLMQAVQRFSCCDNRLRLLEPEGPRIVHTITEAISNGAVANHRTAIIAYLTERGLQPHADGEMAILAMISGRKLRLEFDAQD